MWISISNGKQGVSRGFVVLLIALAGIVPVSFGSLYDHDQSITGPAYRAVFPDLPTPFVDKIIDSMSHFGVFRQDGTPKPGWNELKEQVAAYYQRQ